MSRGLQRVVVRLLHDPAFRDRVYAGERVPVLTAEEEGWIRAVDRRAWDTDPYRRARVFHALVTELPVATAARGIDGWESFFGSPAFHDAVQERGELVEAYAAWLSNPFAVLERAIARVRRRRWTGCARAGCVEVPEGTLAAWTATRSLTVEQVLARARVESPEEGAEWLLVSAAGVAEVGEGLHELVQFAETHDLDATRAEARRLGAGDELVEELVDDGVLAAEFIPPRAG